MFWIIIVLIICAAIIKFAFPGNDNYLLAGGIAIVAIGLVVSIFSITKSYALPEKNASSLEKSLNAQKKKVAYSCNGPVSKNPFLLGILIFDLAYLAYLLYTGTSIMDLFKIYYLQILLLAVMNYLIFLLSFVLLKSEKPASLSFLLSLAYFFAIPGIVWVVGMIVYYPATSTFLNFFTTFDWITQQNIFLISIPLIWRIIDYILTFFREKEKGVFISSIVRLFNPLIFAVILCIFSILWMFCQMIYLIGINNLSIASQFSSSFLLLFVIVFIVSSYISDAYFPQKTQTVAKFFGKELL